MLPRAHSIIGRWCPSAGATGYRLLDRVGSNHGTLINMDAASDWVASGGKLALDFDGSNDSVQRDDVFDRYVTGASGKFSLSAWIYLTANGVRTIASKWGDTNQSENQRQWLFRCNDSNLEFGWSGSLSTGSLLLVRAGTAITQSRWTHVAFSFDASISSVTAKASIYIDGAKQSLSTIVNQNPSAIQDGAAKLAIGATVGSTGAGVSFFTGRIDDIIFYTVPIGEPEAMEIYRLGRGYGVYPDFDFDDANILAPAFRPYWASRRSQLIGGGV